MEGLKNLHNENKMTFVRNVGYPNPNKSHFRSSDIWNTGSAADEYLEEVIPRNVESPLELRVGEDVRRFLDMQGIWNMLETKVGKKGYDRVWQVSNKGGL